MRPAFNVSECGVDGIVTSIRFGSGCYSENCFAQNNACFRHADKSYCSSGCYGYLQYLRCGHSHFFCGSDHNASSNETWVFSSGKHACQIMQCCIRVGSAHGFNESAGYIVVIVSCFVVAQLCYIEYGANNLRIDYWATLSFLRCRSMATEPAAASRIVRDLRASPSARRDICNSLFGYSYFVIKTIRRFDSTLYNVLMSFSVSALSLTTTDREMSGDNRKSLDFLWLQR